MQQKWRVDVSQVRHRPHRDGAVLRLEFANHQRIQRLAADQIHQGSVATFKLGHGPKGTCNVADSELREALRCAEAKRFDQRRAHNGALQGARGEAPRRARQVLNAELGDSIDASNGQDLVEWHIPMSKLCERPDYVLNVLWIKLLNLVLRL